MNQKSTNQENMEIKPIQLHQVKDVKQMIVTCAFELWQTHETIEELEKYLEEAGEFKDLNDVQITYLNNKGTFKVLIDNNNIVGAGAIRKLDEEICELRRMWFLKEYRGKGLGSKMAQKLLEFAKAEGYKKIRLDVYHPEMQMAAVALYKKLGFYEIPAYNKFPAKLWMEKVL